MNTKLLVITTFSIVCLCGCELGTDRVYMEMYEAMKANSDAIQISIVEKIMSMQKDVKSKPDYKALVPAAKEIEKLTSDFNKFINGLDEHLDERGFKAIEDDEIKGEIIAHRHKVIETLKNLSVNKTLWIKDEEIESLIELHFFPSGTLPPINGKLFDDYSFENQSIACNKAIFAKQKNDALMLTKITVDYLAGKIGHTALIFDRFVVVTSPHKNYIKMGETFKADVFLSTAANKAEVTAKIDGKTYPVKNGVIQYEAKPDRYGTHKYEAKITITNPFNNKSETYRRTFAFEVGECYY